MINNNSIQNNDISNENERTSLINSNHNNDSSTNYSGQKSCPTCRGTGKIYKSKFI